MVSKNKTRPKHSVIIHLLLLAIDKLKNYDILQLDLAMNLYNINYTMNASHSSVT